MKKLILKLANITPIFKKDDPLDKSNYRPVSILPLLSKVYERIIYNQLSQHSEQFLNSILCGFREAHNTQHPFFKLLHSWQRELDSSGFVGTILMDLSKAYYCISQELLIAKLECYGLGKIRLKLILNVIKSEVCNFADDKKLYSFDKKLDAIFSNLKYDLENVLSWFQANSLKASPSKFQFMILGG